MHAHDDAADDCPECNELLATALTGEELSEKYAHYLKRDGDV